MTVADGEIGGISILPYGWCVFVSDCKMHVIRAIEKGMIRTIAGRSGVSGFADGYVGNECLNEPRGLHAISSFSLLIADHRNRRIAELTQNLSSWKWEMSTRFAGFGWTERPLSMASNGGMTI